MSIDPPLAEMAKIGFRDIRRTLTTWGMSKDKERNAIQFVTLVDSGACELDLGGAARERLAHYNDAA